MPGNLAFPSGFITRSKKSRMLLQCRWSWCWIAREPSRTKQRSNQAVHSSSRKAEPKGSQQLQGRGQAEIQSEPCDFTEGVSGATLFLSVSVSVSVSVSLALHTVTDREPEKDLACWNYPLTHRPALLHLENKLSSSVAAIQPINAKSGIQQATADGHTDTETVCYKLHCAAQSLNSSPTV